MHITAHHIIYYGINHVAIKLIPHLEHISNIEELTLNFVFTFSWTSTLNLRDYRVFMKNINTHKIVKRYKL